MSSFLIKKKESKTFEDRLANLSVKTRQNIQAAVNSFDKFCIHEYDGRNKDKIIAELKTIDDTERVQAYRDVLQSWIDWQYQNGKLTSGIKQYLSKIKRFFNHHGIRYHFEDFDEPLEYKPKIKEELHQLTLEEIETIFKVAKPRKIGYYLALISTGARPSELLQVRKKDIGTSKKRIKIRIEAENVKTRSGRSVWLTKEAGHYLMTRIKNLNDNDLVWATNENPSYAEKNESNIFNSYTDKVGLNQKYKSNGFRKITLYSFRSYFFGKAADVHREGYAHRMTGHGGYLPQYDRMSDEQKLEWFLKLEPELTVNSDARQKLELLTQKQKINELEKTEESRKKHEQKIKELEDKLSDLSDSQLAMINTLSEMAKIDKKSAKKFARIYEKSMEQLSDPENFK